MTTVAPAAEVATEPELRGREVRFSYIPAFEGIRAIAVFGVLLYHGGAPLIVGGFLGVNMFFVLSGFLITSLLLGEWMKRLTIKLGQFWTRRARRLLPALLVMLIGVAIYARVFATPGEFSSLRLDSLSTLFYVANWHFILSGGNYFSQAAAPSPLLHMWSLSIEEQFYVIWPPVVLVLLGLGHRLRPARRLWPVLAVAIAGTLVSAWWMHHLYDAGASIDRLYEGTDTRAQDLLVGAVLAIVLALWAQHRRRVATVGSSSPGRVHPSAGTLGTVPPRPHRRDLHRRRGASPKPIEAWEVATPWVRGVLQVLGWVGLVFVLVLWCRLDGPTAFLFNGGDLLVAVAVALVILAIVTAQSAPLAVALGNGLFRYLGKISYGTYLWHFPLFLLLDAGRVHLYGLPLLVVRILATVAVATASYYLVEVPVRQGRMRTITEWRAWLLTSAAFLGVVSVTMLATLPTAADAAPGLRPTGASFVGPPVRITILGDSVAYRLGAALLDSQPQLPYDVTIDNAAIVACGVLRTTEYRGHGVTGTMIPACNPTAPVAQQWPALWQANVDGFKPNVVVILAGRWEVQDRLIDGRWEHVGQPAFDAALHASLEQAVTTATSSGALAVLMTAPCFSEGEQPNGAPWPEDSPERLAAYNAEVRSVAAAHPATVRLDDFDHLLCPHGVYTPEQDGVEIRDADGVHIAPTAAAGQWLDQHWLADVVAVGRIQMAGDQLPVPNAPAKSS